ncbi:hypothetical protein AB4068_00935 [Arthrobacter sp. 2RAF22]|uniref:hypothetical protein n=1 Tax=Arthrobacter sp. 2RAF22 TaxID=3232996 RepID=UPI003F8F619D
MTWTRLDDGWTDQQILAGLPIETRWHYLCMVQFCSRTKRFDGFIRAVDARRCSDVADPLAAVKQLLEVGLLTDDQGGYVVRRMEEEHAPPPWVRNRTESNKLAKRRQRAHEANDHALCLPSNCDLANRADKTADMPDTATIADRHADKTADSRTETGSGQKREEAPKTEIEAVRSVNTNPDVEAAWGLLVVGAACSNPGCDGRLNQGQVNKGSAICLNCEHHASISRVPETV